MSYRLPPSGGRRAGSEPRQVNDQRDTVSVEDSRRNPVAVFGLPWSGGDRATYDLVGYDRRRPGLRSRSATVVIVVAVTILLLTQVQGVTPQQHRSACPAPAGSRADRPRPVADRLPGPFREVGRAGAAAGCSSDHIERKQVARCRGERCLVAPRRSAGSNPDQSCLSATATASAAAGPRYPTREQTVRRSRLIGFVW